MDLKRLSQTAEKALKAENCPESVELSVLLTDDKGITELNKRYLGKDQPTDVLSFYVNEELERREGVLGDVVISTETARLQALERDKSLDNELDLLLTHGILHLLGYTDYTDETRQQMNMRAAEIIGQEAAR